MPPPTVFSTPSESALLQAARAITHLRDTCQTQGEWSEGLNCILRETFACLAQRLDRYERLAMVQLELKPEHAAILRDAG
jgi:hypothetical protein